MSWNAFRKLLGLSAEVKKAKARRAPSRPPRWGRHRPLLETLEDRTAPAILFTVNSLADGPVNLSDSALTLRDALFAAQSGDVIDFEPSLFAGGPGTITLTQGEL